MGAPLGNQYALGNKGGRVSTYQPEYAEQVPAYLEWLTHNPVVIKKTRTLTDHRGKSKTEEEIIESPRLMSIEGFAEYIGCAYSTIVRWADEHKEMKAAVEQLSVIQRRWLEEQARGGEGSPRFAQFLLSAVHGLREKTDVTTAGEKIQGFSYVDPGAPAPSALTPKATDMST